MARPLRVEFPYACYHIICRGNFRFPVLSEERDRELLLERLVEYAEIFRVRIRAYCLMANHLHGYVQTEEANLGRFMQSFLTSFTVSYNHRHHTSGHVFQGRYKAFLVEEDRAYASQVSRYIHLNPARIPSLDGAPIEVLQREVRQCPWSSYGALIGLRRCPKWLRRDDILRLWGTALKERQAGYAGYVEQGLTEGMWDPWKAAAAQAIIGSDSFVDRIRRGLTDLAENVNVRSESRQQRTLEAWCSLEDVKAAVAEKYECNEQDLLRRHSRGNESRQVLLYLAATYCRGRYTLSELGQVPGPITVGALSRARGLMAGRIAASAALRTRVSSIEARLKADKANNKD
jgi:REP element-mobilizing transposase RayT